MSKPHDKPDNARRAFLLGAAVAAAGAGLTTEARAEDRTTHMVPDAAQPMGPAHDGFGQYLVVYPGVAGGRP